MPGIQATIKGLLDLGGPVLLPIIMFFIGLGFGIGVRKALGAAIMLGVAFQSMSVVTGFMSGAVGPAAKLVVTNTGKQLTYLDLGWTPVAAITWAWPYAFLMFPLQIGINILMLAMGWTQCLNVDMWNVWNKAYTAVLVTFLSGSLPLGFVFAALEVVMELKQADVSRYQVEELTGIPGVSMAHPSWLGCVSMWPIQWFWKHVPVIKDLPPLDPDALRDRIGVLGENHVVGFLMGVFIAVIARYDLKQTLTLAIQSGTALTLFPMVARLFITALMPIADGAKDFMGKRFEGRELSIGLDWPFTAGLNSMWVAGMLMVPFNLLFAFFLPGNQVLPYGGVQGGGGYVAALLTGNDVIQTFLVGFLHRPITFLAANVFAPAITELGKAVGQMPADATGISRLGNEMEEFRMAFVWFTNIFTKGQLFPGVVVVPLIIVLYVWQYRELKRRDFEAAVRLGYKEAPAEAGIPAVAG